MGIGLLVRVHTKSVVVTGHVDGRHFPESEVSRNQDRSPFTVFLKVFPTGFTDRFLLVNFVQLEPIDGSPCKEPVRLIQLLLLFLRGTLRKGAPVIILDNLPSDPNPSIENPTQQFPELTGQTQGEKFYKPDNTANETVFQFIFNGFLLFLRSICGAYIHRREFTNSTI